MGTHTNNNYKPKLQTGIHLITITKVFYGKTTFSKIPYFKCKFENENGWFYQKFFLNQKAGSINFIKKLFEAAGVYTDSINPGDLSGKQLAIHIKSRKLIDFLTGEILGQKEECMYFESVGEYELSLINSSKLAV